MITPDGTHVVYKGRAGRLTHSFSSTRWTRPSRRRSRASAGSRGHRSPLRMGDGSASSSPFPLPSRKSPSQADQPSSCAASMAQVGAPLGATTTASSLRRPHLQQDSNACRRPAVSRQCSRNQMGTRGGRSSLAPVLARPPGGSVYDHPDDGRRRCIAGGRARLVDRQTEDPDAGRQPGAVRVERPPDLRRGGNAPRSRLRSGGCGLESRGSRWPSSPPPKGS